MESNYDSEQFLYRDVTDRIIRVFYDVYNELGFGFLESVYQTAMIIALHEAGLDAIGKVKIPVYFRGMPIGEFEADLLVNSKVILELKAACTIVTGHEKQLLNYLHGTVIEVGLILNFGPKAQIRRFAFSNHRKKQRDIEPEN